jgi:hypothetical protein
LKPAIPFVTIRWRISIGLFERDHSGIAACIPCKTSFRPAKPVQSIAAWRRCLFSRKVVEVEHARPVSPKTIPGIHLPDRVDEDAAIGSNVFQLSVE